MSGENLLPRITLRATAEEFAAWRATVDMLGIKDLTTWIRNRCNDAARRAGQDYTKPPYAKKR